jgi:hypothetical protein
MDFIDKILASDNSMFMAVLVIGGLILWFLPALLSLIFNRKHFKYILLACIPAGLSFIAWGGVMVWATTGKVFGKYANKIKEET